MDGAKQKLKEALNNWAEINKKNAEVGFVEGMFNGALVSSSIIDKFSTWLLAGTGATAALMIANLDKLSPALGINTFKYAIHILLISALFGFLSKYKSIHCQIVLATGDEIKKRILLTLEKHAEDKDKITDMANKNDLSVATEIDLFFVINEYCKAFPKVMHPWLKKQFSLGLNDRLAPGRKATNGLFWQGNYAALQFFAFLWFAYVSVNNINVI